MASGDGIVGVTGPRADGSVVDQVRYGKTLEQIVADAHGRYHEATSRAVIYSAANPAAQAVSVALNTTYTGIMLYNPLGSSVNLSLLKVKYALSVAPAAIATLGLIAGLQTSAPTGLTALIVRSNQIGNSQTGAGLVYSAATIVTPVWIAQLEDGFTAAALKSPTQPVDWEGIWMIKPGGFIAVGALTAVTGLGMIIWEEVPIV